MEEMEVISVVHTNEQCKLFDENYLYIWYGKSYIEINDGKS